MASTPEPTVALRWLGRMAFQPALDLQLEAREALIEDRGPPVLFLVEHPPTLTLGRRASRQDILWSDEHLASQGVAVAETPRGGEVTLHAPGQLVVYPVVYVGRQLRRHIQTLGTVTAALVAELGVEGAAFRMDHPGVWVGPRKLASIGIHVRQGVAVQGLSLNLEVDPDLFAALVSCGLPGRPMTSVAACGGTVVPMVEAARRWATLWAQHTGARLQPDPAVLS